MLGYGNYRIKIGPLIVRFRKLVILREKKSVLSPFKNILVLSECEQFYSGITFFVETLPRKNVMS